MFKDIWLREQNRKVVCGEKQLIVFNLVTCNCDLSTLDIWPHDQGVPFAPLFLMAICWKATLNKARMMT